MTEGQWYRVKPPIDSEFLILVVNGRIVVTTRWYGPLFEVGDRWLEAQKTLEDAQFVCTVSP